MRKRAASSRPSYSSGGMANWTSSLRSATIASTSLASKARVSRSTSVRSAAEYGGRGRLTPGGRHLPRDRGPRALERARHGLGPIGRGPAKQGQQAATERETLMPNPFVHVELLSTDTEQAGR